MALQKITLKLGRKTIELTSEQFEELKQDMRDLDRDHHYYRHNYQTYPCWSYPFITTYTEHGLRTTTGGSIGSNSADTFKTVVSDPPSFSGTILSAA